AAAVATAAGGGFVVGGARGGWAPQRALGGQGGKAFRPRRGAPAGEAAPGQAAPRRPPAPPGRGRAPRGAGGPRGGEGGGGGEGGDARLEHAAGDLALARELDQVRQEAGLLVEGRWDPDRAARKYPEVLSRHGLDVLGADRDSLVRLIRASAVRQDIVAAL